MWIGYSSRNCHLINSLESWGNDGNLMWRNGGGNKKLDFIVSQVGPWFKSHSESHLLNMACELIFTPFFIKTDPTPSSPEGCSVFPADVNCPLPNRTAPILPPRKVGCAGNSLSKWNVSWTTGPRNSPPGVVTVRKLNLQILTCICFSPFNHPPPPSPPIFLANCWTVFLFCSLASGVAAVHCGLMGAVHLEKVHCSFRARPAGGSLSADMVRGRGCRALQGEDFGHLAVQLSQLNESG